MFKKVIVTGSLAYDHIMTMPGYFRDHIMSEKLHILNISFIMNTFRQEFGGTGGNIAWTLGFLKTPTTLVAAAGDDFGSYEKHLNKRSIDLSGVKVFKNVHTARGFVTTDGDDNQIWGFYEGAMKNSRTLSLKKLLKEDVIVMIAPNDPQAMIKYVNEAIGSAKPYVFDPAFNIPHFETKDLKKAIKKSEILIGNDYEIELIQEKLRLTKKEVFKLARIVVTTLGAKGSRIETSASSFEIPSAKPKNETDPTGAGDAYRAGFLAGYVRGLKLDVCGKMGAVAAVYTVEKYGTQTHRFTTRDFISRYKQNYGDEFRI